MSYVEFRDEVLARSGGFADVRPPLMQPAGILIKIIHRIMNIGKEDWAQFQIRLEKATLEVLERWIAEKKYDGILAFAVGNYDTTGGDSFLTRFSEELEMYRDVLRIRKLWNGILANRMRCFGKPIPDDDPSLGPRESDVRNSVIIAMEYFQKP